MMQVLVGIICVVIWMIAIAQEILFWKKAEKIPGKVIDFCRNKRPSVVGVVSTFFYVKIVSYTYRSETKQVTSDWASLLKPNIGKTVVVGIAKDGKARIYAPVSCLLHTTVFVGVFYILIVYVFLPVIMSSLKF